MKFVKYIAPILLFIVFFSTATFADERTTLFEGFNAKIVSVVDDMTDKKSGVIFLDFGLIYMAIYRHNDFTIWANDNDLNFAFDVKNLIRVGESRPFSLEILRRNGLKLSNAINAESIIKSLAKGEEIKLRYYTWPQYTQVDRKLQNPNFGFIYYKAAKLFGWKDFGVSSELAPVKLNISLLTDYPRKDHVRVTVDNNHELGLIKNSDKNGGGATIMVYEGLGFGLHKNEWICKQSTILGKEHMIIRDSNRNIIFKELLPSIRDEEIWPLGKIAAKKAWESAPLGTIQIEGVYRREVLLYGFRELWKWGVDNAGLPTLE
jgi:hypothetical protein